MMIMGHRGVAALDPDLIKPFADIGVDGIGSNNPGILVDYFRR